MPTSDSSLLNAADPTPPPCAGSNTNRSAGGVGRFEMVALWAFALLLLALKIAYARHYRIDSDEPQHLHTVWAWANGFLPYRDLFDNHTPLFQLLCSPLFRFLGERADIVVMMRLPMIALYALCLCCVYAVVKENYGQRAALWGALLCGLNPDFFLISTEFRTDDLWTLCWLLVLAILNGRTICQITRRRVFLTGLLLGITFGVSMKTSLLLLTFAMAGGVVLGIRWWLNRDAGWRLPAGALLRHVGTGLAGLVIVPAAITLFFYFAPGAWAGFVYCIFKHNLVHGLVEAPGISMALRPYYFPVSAPLLFFVAYCLMRLEPRSARRAWQAIHLLSGGFFLTMLWSYWPILSAEDYQPLIPVAFMALVPLGFELIESTRFCRARFVVIGLISCVSLAALLKIDSPLRNSTTTRAIIVADVLKLTTPGQYVLDGKCESLFRPRPYYYVIETMTEERLRRGGLVDDIAERLIKTRAPVALVTRMPPAARRFISENYVAIDSRIRESRFRVLGKELVVGKDGHATFELKIPERYVVAAPGRQLIAGEMDGTPMNDSRWLGVGKHTFIAGQRPPGMTLLWANAYEKGFDLWLPPEGQALRKKP